MRPAHPGCGCVRKALTERKFFYFFIPVHITGYKLSHLRIQTVLFRSEIIVSGPQGAGYEVCAFFRYIHMRKWLIHQRMLRFRNFYSILML